MTARGPSGVRAEVRAISLEVPRIRARSTLLATGGFGGDPDCASNSSTAGGNLPLRANEGSTGDGLRLGRSAGAAWGSRTRGSTATSSPRRCPTRTPYESVDLTFYHSEHGVLLNLEGRRFVDETIADHISPMYLVEQPEARALLVYDQHVHDNWMLRPYVEGVEPIDKFQLAHMRGARCAIAEDIEEFAELPDQRGYPGLAVLTALQEFNRQHEAGRPALGRMRHARPQARVLDESGEPIPGLVAAGSDTGGVFVRAYAGWLADALIFGLQAAATALASAAVETRG